MRNIALFLTYEGTAYHGWQTQKNLSTVQQTLEKAIEMVVSHKVHVTGCGRTDAGVHAKCYVANFHTESTIPCGRLPYALNTHLPADIVVNNAFEVGGTKWLLLNLDFGPTDAMLEWAGGIIEQYPDHKVIVATHAYMYRNGTTLDSEDCYVPSRYNPVFNDGDEVFDKLVSKYENVVLAIGGHDPWDHIVCSQVKGDHGNTITQLLIDPQYMDNFSGATGMVALLYFSEDGNTMTVRYYSTARDMYGSEYSQFTVTLN